MSVRSQLVVAFLATLSAAPVSARAEEAPVSRVAKLASEPAQGGKRTRNSRREALVGLRLEKLGRLVGPISRDPSGAAEFIDGKGTRWDVKRFDSRWPINKGGFVLEVALRKVRRELDGGQNVILDPLHLRWQHRWQLRAELAESIRTGRVLWYDEHEQAPLPLE